MNTATPDKVPARSLICAVAACVLSVLFLGEISQASVQASPHEVLLQA